MHLTAYALYCIIRAVSWLVEMADEFEPEFNNLHLEVRNEILAHARLLQQFGPLLGRPRVDTLDDSAPQEYEGTKI